MPIWTPDGRSVVFTSNPTGLFQMYRIPADGSGPAERLFESDVNHAGTSWHPGGRLLAFYQIHPETYRDLWVLDTAANEATPFLVTSADERAGMFSPEGQWIAYVSDESGRDEVYVRPYPGPGGKWQISTDGGTGPLWSRDGTRLHYRERGAVMAVDVSITDGFSAGAPRRLFAGDYLSDPNGNANYDVTADGRFLMISGERADSPTELKLVMGWDEVVKGVLE
jgi:serine/threonine-protein kinase